jgi:7,8-dihydro-6-hydroxymethylpterin dimethyltransferase
MAKLYRKEVLGEKEVPGFIALDSIGGIKPAASKAEVIDSIEETVAGD